MNEVSNHLSCHKMANTDDAMTKLFRMAVSHAIAEKMAKGLPVARFDKIKKQAYYEYPDGRREYAE